ncbi:MAG: dUTP diphosphatase [Candidatus Yanofskybacteria bacterium]|nr:dUTP diphosphatase [Candidatus Yanofskybacteria bacterium]
MEISEEMQAYIDQCVDKRIKTFFQKLFFPDFKTYVFSGGKMPQRSTDGAIGFDFFLRAMVCPFEMEPDKILRRTIFDFQKFPKENPKLESRVANYPSETGNELSYELKPNESVLVGVGCTVEMDFPYFHWVAPRSGLATKWKITVTNAPGTVDPDYRGEAGVAVHNIGDEPILLTKHMKIAQGIFSLAVIPNLIEVKNYKELSKTVRGVGGFGSTGIR